MTRIEACNNKGDALTLKLKLFIHENSSNLRSLNFVTQIFILQISSNYYAVLLLSLDFEFFKYRVEYRAFLLRSKREGGGE